jgi:hypothetical protein
MPAPLSRQYRRVMINLNEEDCLQLELRYGRGWTGQVRLLVQSNCAVWAEQKAILEDALKGE